MKKYSFRHFEYDDDLTDWLNENQHINVINIIFIDRIMSYKVFYYTEDNTSGGHRGMG
jgi:hypothetical protein